MEGNGGGNCQPFTDEHVLIQSQYISWCLQLLSRTPHGRGQAAFPTPYPLCLNIALVDQNLDRSDQSARIAKRSVWKQSRPTGRDSLAIPVRWFAMANKEYASGIRIIRMSGDSILLALGLRSIQNTVAAKKKVFKGQRLSEQWQD